MKKKYISAVTILFISIFMLSCKKDNSIAKIDIPVDEASTARIKYFNFASNAPSVNFFANGVKVGGVLSATGSESTAGVTFGSVYPSANYSIIVNGTYKIGSQIPANAAANANVAINELSVNLSSTKYYSFYTSGIYNSTTKTCDAFYVEDKLPPVIDNIFSYVRFVNTISNGTSPMNLVVKNTVTNTEIVVATGIGYKGASDFVSIPFGNYELYVRYPSSSTNVIIRNGTTNGTVGFQSGRTYTIGSRGDMTVTSATAANRPLLDNTANR